MIGLMTLFSALLSLIIFNSCGVDVPTESKVTLPKVETFLNALESEKSKEQKQLEVSSDAFAVVSIHGVSANGYYFSRNAINEFETNQIVPRTI